MSEVKQWNAHNGIVLDSVNGFDVIECEQCGFKHVIPLPTPEELETVYRHDYYTAEKPLYLERHWEDSDWWNLVYGDRYDRFESYLGSNRRRILDVGSGPGFFLLHGKNRGWIVTGIEPSTQAAAHSRQLGLDVVEDFLTPKTAETLGQYDVIHLSNVLEHISEPITLISLVKSLLAPDGIVCISVPNDYNPFQEVLRDVCGYKPWWVAPPHHLNYFDFKSLTKLLENIGITVIDREATFPIEIFLLMGDSYVGNDRLGRLCHTKIKNFESNISLAKNKQIKRHLYRVLGDLNLGREVILYGRLVVSSNIENPLDLSQKRLEANSV